MSVHWIELRWRGRCSRCRAVLGTGELARFDDVTREIACFDCDERRRVARAAAKERMRLTASPPARPPTPAERARVRASLAEARAALNAARRAS
jgi:hypothetical protein